MQAKDAAIVAEPLDLGYGGMLVRAANLLRIGTDLTALFKIEDQPGAFAARSRVAHASAGRMGLAFKEWPLELDRLLKDLVDLHRS